MKLHLKVFALIFAFLAFTWLMPPEYLLSSFTKANIPIAEAAAEMKSTVITAAAKKANSSDTNMMLNDYTLDSSNIVGEVVGKREKYTKHFMMEDGTYQAVMYSSAVNYKKADGTWAEVDNTLIKEDKAGKTVYKTKDNGYMDVAFADEANSEKLVTIKKGQYSLGWKISKANSIIPENNTISPSPESTITPEPSLIDEGVTALPEGLDATNTPESADITVSPDETALPSSTEIAPTKMVFSDISINSVAPIVINDFADRKAKLTGNDIKRFNDKASSHIKYDHITDNVSLDYIIQAERIKENITLYSYIPSFSISFDISTDGLTTNALDGGITAFCDGSKEVFYLMPSYALDSEDNDGRVYTSLKTIAGGYRLTLTPDDDWIKTAAYPVVIDPQIDYDWNPNNINDTYISSMYPNGQDGDGDNGRWYTYASIRYGYNSSLYGNCYSLIKYINLPELKSSEAVVGAYMISERADTYTGNLLSTVHRLLKDWDQEEVTWNNYIGSDPASAFDSTAQEAHYVGDSYGVHTTFYTWNITNLMREWYTGEVENYGFLIKSSTTGSRAFFSSNATYVADQVQTIISYVNAAGLEGYWPYQSMDARRAGTASVNLFTGNLVVSRSDIGTSGNRMPVSISHVYNTVYKDDADIGYGMGWRLNYAQTLVGETISETQYYDYTDEDGTVQYFKHDTGTIYIDESGQNRTLEFNKEITDIDSNIVTYSFTITDKSDNVLCFDSNGRLVKIKDCIGNYISIVYSGTTNKITTITDGAGRSYSFTYYDSGSGDLESITAPGNRTVGFTYDTGNRLIHVTDPDDEQSTYTYNTDEVTDQGIMNNALIEMRNYDGYHLGFSYNSNYYSQVLSKIMFPKVSGIEESADTTQGGSQTFDYYEKETKVTDHLGNINIYQFNQYGNAVTIQDDKGRAVYCQYYDPNASTSDSGKYGQNKISLSSRLQEPVMNYLKNHNLDSTTSWTGVQQAGGTIGIDTSSKYMGTAAIKLYNTSATGQNYYYQSVGITPGKTYTYSAYVKTSAIQDGTGLGACLSLYYYDGAGIYRHAESENLSGTNSEWTRLSVTLTVPQNTTNPNITAYLLLDNQKGTAWFDCAQLEEQPVTNRYNMVENGDMTYASSGVPTSWTKSADCTSSETTTTTADTDRGMLDNNVFKIVGSTTVSKYISQTIMVSGVAGDSFSFGGWGKANSVPLATTFPYGTYSRRFAINIHLYSGTTDRGGCEAKFNDFSDLWQYVSGRVVATGAFDRATISVVYAKNLNTAWFDGIELYKEEFGQCYDYDKDGNLITAKDLSSNTNSVEYDDDNNPISLQPPDCTGDDKYTSTYLTGNQKHLVDTATTVEDVKSKYFYDTYGNTTQAETRDDLDSPTAYIRTQADYTQNGNYIDKSYDARGNYSQYNYSPNYGVNLSTTDPMSQAVSYTYDGDNGAIEMGKLTNVSATVGGTTYSNSYGYTDDLLTTITHNGFNYTIGYNPFGQTTTVGVAGQNLVTNTYITGDRSYLLDYLTYGNGGKVDYAYDDRYRVTGITYDNEANPRYTYAYAANGQLGSVKDNENNLTTNLYYDLAERPMKTVEQYTSGLRRTFQYKYDMDNCLTEFLELFDTTQFKTALTYDKDNRITKVNYNDQAAGSENVRYTYDVLGRLGTRTLETGANDYVLTYNYLAGGYAEPGSTTSMISSIDYNGASSLSYTYDACGRILSVSDGTNTIQYEYDGLGQLLRTDDPTDTRGDATGSTWAYAYDAGGNITSKTLYAFCPLDEDLSDNTAVDSFAYAYDNTWKDKLTSYDGNTITYDDIGNPLTYDGWTYTWEAGRQLEQMSNGSTALQFKYNDAGLRTQKINGATTTKYYWAGSNISHMTSGSDTLHFYYDADGIPTMVTYNDTDYYYQHNVQGDIIGLMDTSGAAVVSYTYDSWGKRLSCTGSLESTLGAANPLRYRGYIFDEETGLYYLQSRYYSPEWGRFINADSIVKTINLYRYCNNNPVNTADPTGHKPPVAGYIDEYNDLVMPINQEPSKSKPWIAPINHNVPLYTQTGNLCWAYCQTMIESYKNGTILNQSQADARAKDIAIAVNGQTNWDQGGWPTNCGGDIYVNCIEDLYVKVRENGPVYGFYWNCKNGKQSQSHLVVVTGVDLDKGVVYTNNPWGVKGEQSYNDFSLGFAGGSTSSGMIFRYILRTK